MYSRTILYTWIHCVHSNQNNTVLTHTCELDRQLAKTCELLVNFLLHFGGYKWLNFDYKIIVVKAQLLRILWQQKRDKLDEIRRNIYDLLTELWRLLSELQISNSMHVWQHCKQLRWDAWDMHTVQIISWWNICPGNIDPCWKYARMMTAKVQLKWMLETLEYLLQHCTFHRHCHRK